VKTAWCRPRLPSTWSRCWDGVYAFNEESFGPTGTLGHTNEREAVLVRDLREALVRLNPQLRPPSIDNAVTQLTHHDFSRSLLQHNQAFHKLVSNSGGQLPQRAGLLSHTRDLLTGVMAVIAPLVHWTEKSKPTPKCKPTSWIRFICHCPSRPTRLKTKRMWRNWLTGTFASKR
jgi:hypothetical protein